jgi:predicted DCC family thiol-disulfide oxidoreductase YuxK
MQTTLKLVPVKAMPNQAGLESFTVRAMRHLLFHAETNGLAKSGAIIKIGRKTLIDVPRFIAWLNTQRIS